MNQEKTNKSSPQNVTLTIPTEIPVLQTDQTYYVEATGELYALLHRSNYSVLHRPWMVMRGSTRDAVTVKPYGKIAVDAAPISRQPITLEQFLKLFENESS